ncbi:MAG TPA: FtsX-like permease family protein [Kofleriaceae bacterium]|nr:FtsX-like permease family protein [Kofleriaceae bacterium]
MVPIPYNVRSLLVRKATTLATAGGIALAVFVFAGAQMLGAGVNRAMVSSGRPDNVVILRKGSENELSSGITNEYKKLGDRPQVAQVAGVGAIGEIVIVLTKELTDDPSATSNVLVRGMPAEGIAFRAEVKIVSGRAPKPGTDEVIVGKAISGRFKDVGPGQSLELRRNRPLHVVGEFTAGGSSYESEVWGDLDTIRKYLGREGAVSSVRVRLADPSQFEAYRASVEGDKDFSVKAMREQDYYEKQSQGTSGFLSVLGTVISVLFAIAAMIGAAITMNGAIANRTKEIGTLRALGFSRIAILCSFVLEAIFLSLLGGAVGLASAMLLSLKSIRTMNFQTFSDIVISFQPTSGIVIGALVFSVVMGLLGGLIPAIRASRVSPVEAMRG